jgi:hypothetical protein
MERQYYSQQEVEVSLRRMAFVVYRNFALLKITEKSTDRRYAVRKGYSPIVVDKRFSLVVYRGLILSNRIRNKATCKFAVTVLLWSWCGSCKSVHIDSIFRNIHRLTCRLRLGRADRRSI